MRFGMDLYAAGHSSMIPISPNIRLTCGGRLKLFMAVGDSVTSKLISPPSDRIVCSNAALGLVGGLVLDLRNAREHPRMLAQVRT
jgi:hypothetical protein